MRAEHEGGERDNHILNVMTEAKFPDTEEFRIRKNFFLKWSASANPRDEFTTFRTTTMQSPFSDTGLTEEKGTLV